MNNVALPFEYPFGKYHDGAYDCFIGGRDGELDMRLHLFTAWVDQEGRLQLGVGWYDS